jgi:phosphonate degradation associated HDIG domain protein
MNVVDEILRMFEKRGSEAYFGEPVSVTEHSLQTAHAAQLEGAPARLVVAALLHDIGHLVDHVPDDIAPAGGSLADRSVADWTVDARHEEVGGRWLAMWFAPEIHEPVRLHVPAKRYLCAVDTSYFARLSPASVRTLELQGGPMSMEEVAAFETERFFAEAVRIRRWDDQGKVHGLATPHLEEYGDLIAPFGALIRESRAG